MLAEGKRGCDNGVVRTKNTRKARRTARSPGPATGLPGTVPPARDGSTFHRPHSIRQYQKTIDKNGNKHVIDEGVPGSAQRGRNDVLEKEEGEGEG